MFSQGPKADVYGLLLPDKLAKSSNNGTQHTTASTLATTAPTTSEQHTEPTLNTMNGIKSPNDTLESEAMDVGLHDSSKAGPPVVKRRSSTGNKKLRNRKSALYAEYTDPPQQDYDIDNASADLMPSMNVQILSVSPEHPAPGETSIESRQGRLSDLVKQFEHREAEDGVAAEGDIGGKGKRRKPSNKAFEMFERKGIVIGMVK